MKTREQIEQNYKAELRKVETEERILAALPGLEPSMIHVHELYGRAGSIQFGESYQMGKAVSLPKLAELLQALPPIPAVHAKGTYTRFLSEEFADSDANKEKGKETITRIFPVTLETNSVCGYSLKAEWFTKIGAETWEVSVYLQDAYRLVQVNSRRREFVGGHRYVSSESTCKASESINPPEGTWSQVKWAAGSEEWPPNFTLYHTQFDDSPVAWVERTIENLKTKATVAA